MPQTDPLRSRSRGERASTRRCGLFVALLLAGYSLPAHAQMVLPGAVAPEPEGATQRPASNPRPRPVGDHGVRAEARVPAPAVVPAVATLAGKSMALNGGKTQITFQPHDKDVEVAHLTLGGEQMTDTRTACQIDVANMPIAVTPIGRPNGVERVKLAFPACPIAFDVLDGAVLADPAVGVCEFKEANCRVNPTGLWGPQSGDIGPDRVKLIEHERTLGEGAVRADYKALMASTKDRPTIMGFARDQAQFSSTREETCRDYVGEGRHGFCAAKVTEARAAFLRTKLDEALLAKAERKNRKRVGLKSGKP